MDVRFTKQQLEDWYTGNFAGKQPFSSDVLKQYRKTVNQLAAAPNLATLRTIKGLNLHELKRDLAGKYAVRVNKQYRVVFTWTKDGALEIIDIDDLTDYH